MKKVTVKNVALLLVVAYVIIAIWHDPAAMGDTVGNFLRATASWIGDLFDKIATFLSSLKS